jgi:hypothetical protein
VIEDHQFNVQRRNLCPDVLGLAAPDEIPGVWRITTGGYRIDDFATGRNTQLLELTLPILEFVLWKLRLAVTGLLQAEMYE